MAAVSVKRSISLNAKKTKAMKTDKTTEDREIQIKVNGEILEWFPKYRKIPKISPGAYIFQRPFLRSLILEGPIFGGAYVRREICVSNLIGLACSGKEIYHFCFVLLCIRGQIPSTSPPGGLFSEGRLNGGFLRYDFGGLIFGGACTWRGLFSEFYGMFIWDLQYLEVEMRRRK